MIDNEKKILASPRIHAVVYIIGACILGLLIFSIGMVFEAHNFDMVHRSHHNERPGEMILGMSLPHTFIENRGGTVGTITNIKLPTTITIQTRTGSTETIDVGASTIIHGITSSTTLTTGESVIVLGNENSQGDIVAYFIRVVPSSSQVQ